MFPDEFGYWASAAEVVGYDWTEVASMGSYYSFGYSVILTGILKIFGGGTAAYRAAVTVNMILMCTGVCLLQDLLRRLFPDMEKLKQIFLCGIAVCYPAWIFYMQMTMTEALLMFLFLLNMWLCVCFLQKPTVFTASFLAVSLVYLYSVHMRTVGVAIACMITLTIFMLQNHKTKKTFLIFSGILLGAAVIAAILKNRVILEVFAGADREQLAGNDYGSQWSKFAEILTPAGMFRFLKEIIAKIYYLGVSSYGIFYWAMGWCLKEIWVFLQNIRRKKASQLLQYVGILLLMVTVGEVLISSIFMYKAGLVDTLIYGRYTEFLMPVLMVIGIYNMWSSRWLFRVTCFIGFVQGLVTMMLQSMVHQYGLERIRGYFVVGVSSLIDEKNFEPVSFLRNVWIAGTVVMLIAVCLICISRRWKSTVWVLSGILLLEIMTGLQASNHYTYKVNEVNFTDQVIAEKIREQFSADADIMYLDEDYPEYIDFIQMQLPAYSISVIQPEKLIERVQLGDCVIAYHETKYDEQLEQFFEKKITSSTYTLYINK